MLKKIIPVVLTIIMLFSMMTAAYAEEGTMKENDSRYVSGEVLRNLDLEGSDSVIKMYNIDVMFAFYEYENIDAVLTNCKPGSAGYQELYAVMSGKEVLSYQAYYSVDGWAKHQSPINYVTEEALFALQNVEALLKNISKDIKVNGVYYLSAVTMHQGTVVYYETNQGDYVYCDGGGKYTSEELLMPLKEFRELVTAICDELKKRQEEAGTYLYGGGVDLNGVYDISPYIINTASIMNTSESPGPNVFLIVGIIVLCVALVITVVLFVLKKKAGMA